MNAWKSFASSVYEGTLVLVNRTYPLRSGDGPLCSVGTVLLHPAAAHALHALLAHIAAQEQIVTVSGWRSQDEQQEIWDDSIAQNGREFTQTYVALPGHSEHQSGLAVDLALRSEQIDFIRPEFPYDGICASFRANAAAYGFIERYPAGAERITGIGAEPWHFRYVGVPHAQIIEREGITLEEYIQSLRDGRVYEHCTPDGRACVRFLDPCDNATPAGRYEVSGDNISGYILTEWRDEP